MSTTPITPNPSAYYRLTNAYTGPSAPLSIYRDRATGSIYLTTRTPTNTPDWNPANNERTITPYWQILPVHGSDPPRFHICAEFDEGEDNNNDNPTTAPGGGSVFLALDVFSEDKSKPHLTRPGYYSGQFWSVTAWEGRVWRGRNRWGGAEEKQEGGGDAVRQSIEDDDDEEEDDDDFYYKDEDNDRPGTIRNVMLTNDYSGQDLHLDTYSDTKQGFLGDGDHTGQHWVLERVVKKGSLLSSSSFKGGEKVEVEEQEEEGQAGEGKNSVIKRLLMPSPQRIFEQGRTMGLFAFGIGFGAAVVVAMAWVELLPLLLVVGLSVAGGVSLGLMSPRGILKTNGTKRVRWMKN